MLAAAIIGRADVIVTYNLDDFPADALDPYGIEAQHPDAFLTHQLDLATDLVIGVVRDLRTQLRMPPRSVGDYLTTLEKHDLKAFAAALRGRTTAL